MSAKSAVSDWFADDRARADQAEQQLAVASFAGHYISTACQGGKHEHCRLTNKWDGSPCLCACGHANVDLPLPTLGDLLARNERLTLENAMLVKGMEHFDHIHDLAVELQEQVSEYDRLFELQWKRMGEATRRWRAATGPEAELLMPDLGALLAWMLEQMNNERTGTRIADATQPDTQSQSSQTL